ncbi:MAG: helix-turn-helix transcriptional regulator [Clostridia bacterium]|nr:helix-turn-helix transcriptional regulator [Clostridia bacterium]
MRKKLSTRKCLFAERIRELREQKGLKQNELAKILGFGLSAISDWETRGKEPSFSTLMELSIIFGVPSDYLLGLEDL